MCRSVLASARIGRVAPPYEYLDAIVDGMIRQSLAERTPSLKEVKQTLLAKGNEAVIMQKLSALQNHVVPATSVDDPLVDDPPTLVDFDLEGGTLILVLSRPGTPAWIKQFHAMNSYGSVSSIIAKRSFLNGLPTSSPPEAAIRSDHPEGSVYCESGGKEGRNPAVSAAGFPVWTPNRGAIQTDHRLT